MRTSILIGAVCAAAAGPVHAQAQNWPTKPVRLVVPFALGGATDIVARILAPALGETLGQPFVVENRAGAGGNIGTEIVAKSPPDGHHVLVGNISTNAVNPSGFAGKLKFDPVKDLVGVTLIASVPTVLVAGASFPPNSVAELVEYARARPGVLNYSNPIGAYSHFDTIELAARAGIQVVHVPSKGAGSAVTPLMTGDIHFSFLNAASVIPHIKAGRLKVYATTARERLPELPGTPTMAEAGYAGIGSVNWNGFFMPAKTPEAIVARLHAATVQAMRQPQVKDAFEKSYVPITLSASPAEFQAYLRDEVARWARIVRESGVKLQ